MCLTKGSKEQQPTSVRKTGCASLRNTLQKEITPTRPFFITAPFPVSAFSPDYI